MLFSKKEFSTPKLVERSLQWPNPNGDCQSLNVWVKEVNFQLIPTLTDENYVHAEIDFVGRVTTDSFRDIEVIGSISQNDPNIPLRMLEDHWDKVPDNIHGHGRLSQVGSLDPSFMFNFICGKEAFSWVHQTFIMGLWTSGKGIGIQIDFTFPGAIEEGFWNNRWQEKWWQVMSWKLSSNVCL